MIHKVVCTYRGPEDPPKRESEGEAVLWKGMADACKLECGYEERNLFMKEQLEPAMRNTEAAENLVTAMNLMKTLFETEKVNRRLEHKLDVARVIEESLYERIVKLEIRLKSTISQSSTQNQAPRFYINSPSGHSSSDHPFASRASNVVADEGLDHPSPGFGTRRTHEGLSIHAQPSTYPTAPKDENQSPARTRRSVRVAPDPQGNQVGSTSRRGPVQPPSPPVAELQNLNLYRTLRGGTGTLQSIYDATLPPPRPAAPYTGTGADTRAPTHQVNAPSIGRRLQEKGVFFWNQKVIAQYDFAGDAFWSELSFDKGEVLQLGMHAKLEDNLDWMYCKSERGEHGYVPRSYLAYA
ncbi:hypothetical protein FRC09_003943 [Ceratobasidium sp. 395]|nr:hypothetical protein FRC09_003943 [Ceratobasidium sp. 395]